MVARHQNEPLPINIEFGRETAEEAQAIILENVGVGSRCEVARDDDQSWLFNIEIARDQVQQRRGARSGSLWETIISSQMNI